MHLPEIRRLPASIVNKIAAGEVIERPASVVKELVENALDAGATRVDVAVEKGGSELVRVVDDGCGIPPEQIPLAVTSHATSKLASADDLFSVRTLGFRGEALASIAEVSRLLLRSRVPGESAGAEVEVTGGEMREVAPCGAPTGTTIEVRNLFFNTPVRRKFLRTTQTEMGHASEAVTRLALAQPGVQFTLRHGNRTVYDLPPTGDIRERVAHFFGEELAGALIWVENEFEGVRLSGYVANPMHSRSHNRMQYLFLNGRFIRDRALQHALGEAYRGLLLTGRYPIAFLQLEMPPELVDVNVHPTKLEVRFQDSGRIYSQLLGTLRTRFLSVDLTAMGRAGATQTREQPPEREQEAQRMRQELVDWAKGELARRAPNAPAEPAPAEAPSEAASSTGDDSQPLELNPIEPPQFPPPGDESAPAAEQGAASEEKARPWEAEPVNSQAAMQVHLRYLVSETDEGMIVIDQHALHERILYEQLRTKVLEGALETQRLLVSEPVDLAPEEAAAVLEAQEILAKLGVIVEPFGGDTVLVTAYPAMLSGFRPGEVLREVARQLLAGGEAPQRRDLIDELLHMMSCKAAIKAGDRLSSEEIVSLLEQRHLAQDAHHCPHGRPTALVFTREELDRQFKRV